MLRVVALAGIAGAAYGCSRPSSLGGTLAGGAVISLFNTPANLPPTPAPTPPPPPPPLKVGWVPAVYDTGVNQMTRQNCEKTVEFLLAEGASGAQIDRDKLQEQFQYRCTYQMYVEVDLFNTHSTTGCSCGLSWIRQVPPQDPNFEAAYDTQITTFSMQVYDRATETPIGAIPNFGTLQPAANATDTLSRQVHNGLIESLTTRGMDGNVQSFEEVTTAFAGSVQGQFQKEDIPLLDPAHPENVNHVPVMCFTVVDTYRTTYRWPEPPVPVMSRPPNAWVTNCVPFIPSDLGAVMPTDARKRWHALDDPKYAGVSYWFREFLTFSATATGVSPGWTPQSRYLTAYYAASDCQVVTGVATFDREFSSVITTNSLVFGGFNWQRTYQTNGFSIIGGAPKTIVTDRYSRLGFHTIEFRENFARNQAAGTNGAFRPGMLFMMLNGTYAGPTDDPAQQNPPLGWAYNAGRAGAPASTPTAHRYKMCETLPIEWATCSSICSATDARAGTCKCAYTDDRYLESVYYWHVDASVKCETKGFFRACPIETTYLSFQNLGTGALARDFSKKKASLLLTGPRSAFCQPTAPVPVAFDPLTFKPIDSSNSMNLKRAASHVDGVFMTAATSARTHNLAFKRALGLLDPVPEKPVFGAPETQPILMQAAAGSANPTTLQPGGDHPMALFPETYTVPLSLDPNDEEFLSSQQGFVFDNSFSPCLAGTQGCNCRQRADRPACDAPLVCSTAKYCVDPPCVVGAAGCDCAAGNTCANANLECEPTTRTCVFRETCTPGNVGCTCNALGACTDGLSSCTEGNCLAYDCPAGLPGCACDNTVATRANFCALEGSVCDTVSQICAAPVVSPTYESAKLLGARCTNALDCAGSPGAVCSTAGVCVATPCTPGTKGCHCAAGACAAALDSCDALTGMCLTDACEQGTGGCLCYRGFACSAGFECVSTADGSRRTSVLPVAELAATATRTDRCVRERCADGDNGCACTSACNSPGFQCKIVDTVTSERRCVATGHVCGSQTARCIAYCGVGRVRKCPGCEDQIPICVVGDAGAALGTPAALLAAFLLMLAAMLELTR